MFTLPLVTCITTLDYTMKLLLCMLFITAVACAEEKVDKDKKTEKRGLLDIGYGYGGDYHDSSDAEEYQGSQGFEGGQYGIDEGGHDKQIKSITITKVVKVPVHKPYPVPVVKEVKVPVYHPVPVHVDKPYPVYVKKPVPYTVYKHIPYEVIKHVPYTVHVPVKVPVEHPVPVHITKPVPYEVKVPVKVPVAQPYAVYKPVPVYVKSNHGEHGSGHEGIDFSQTSYGSGFGNYGHY